jgi:hypothetical protein
MSLSRETPPPSSSQHYILDKLKQIVKQAFNIISAMTGWCNKDHLLPES